MCSSQHFNCLKFFFGVRCFVTTVEYIVAMFMILMRYISLFAVVDSYHFVGGRKLGGKISIFDDDETCREY